MGNVGVGLVFDIAVFVRLYAYMEPIYYADVDDEVTVFTLHQGKTNHFNPEQTECCQRKKRNMRNVWKILWR